MKCKNCKYQKALDNIKNTKHICTTSFHPAYGAITAEVPVDIGEYFEEDLEVLQELVGLVEKEKEIQSRPCEVKGVEMK